ncbi:MAG: SoxR reducing system RseC family protein [Deltaproteobacteria bacterium]|nr:SoxR reducing system RseC family protein [Deltaproteobacteria bacterium]
MLTEEGIVLEAGAGSAYVQTVRTDACAGCSGKEACEALGGGNRENKVRVINPMGAEVGDRVVLGLSGDSFIKTSFLLYMVPVLGLIGGGILGHQLAPVLSMRSEPAAIIFSFSCLVLTFPVIRIIAKKLEKKKAYIPTIISILAHKQENLLKVGTGPGNLGGIEKDGCAS